MPEATDHTNKREQSGVPSKRLHRQKWLSCFLWILFILYLWALSRMNLVAPLHLTTNGSSPQFNFQAYNLVPMNFVNTLFYLADQHDQEFRSALFSVVQIFMAALPLGFFVPILLRKPMEFERFIGMTLLIGTLIETIQFFFATGNANVDDLILCMLGSILGFALWHLLSDWLAIDHQNRNHCLIVISLIIFCTLMVQFAEMSHANSSGQAQRAVIRSLGIPDYAGTLLASSRKTLTLQTDDNQGKINLSVQLSAATQIYTEENARSHQPEQAVYKHRSLDHLSRLHRNVPIRVWGKEQKGNFHAEIIIIRSSSAMDTHLMQTSFVTF
ncbi:VanZ family protein [Sporolactobacillus terrae]|uniref:VanZ family protein n=1 Tax=Sporolactobacillus terrae TaxID=269673 RepID=UPI0011180B65|nr:VanZ family protein [Sporolactobacillus terrae]